MSSNSHVHILLSTLAAKPNTRLSLAALSYVTSPLVGEHNVHVVSPTDVASLVEQPNIIEIPEPHGSAASAAFAACHIYRQDPTAVLVYVDADLESAPSRIEMNFERLVAEAETPGSLVSLGASHEANAGIYAWSIYSFIESYRNYCPVDFQILNEMVKTWSLDSAWRDGLFHKLVNEPIHVRLLSKVTNGYSTRNVIVPEEASPIAPVRSGDVSKPAFTSFSNPDA